MTDDTKPILCGKCEVPLEGPTNPGANDTMRCPRCGITEKFHKVAAEVNHFLADHTSQQISKTMRSVARGSKHLKVTTKPVKKRHYRFIVDL